MIVRQLINELMEYPLDMEVQIELYNDHSPIRSSIADTYRSDMFDENDRINGKSYVLIYGDDI